MVPATDRQKSFLRTLLNERTVEQHGITDVDAFLATTTLTKQQASSLIDNLLRMPRSANRARTIAQRNRPAEVTSTGSVENGTYTIVNGDGGDYVTLRIKAHWEADRAARGDQVVQYLSGPDNTTNFTGFAFLNGGTARVWGRMVGRVDRQVSALTFLINQGIEDRSASRERYALRSGRCSNCGRRLTVPASLHRGLGPECARRLGAEDSPGFVFPVRDEGLPTPAWAQAAAPEAIDQDAAFTIYSDEGTFTADTAEEAMEFAASTLTTQYEIRDRHFNKVAVGNEDANVVDPDACRGGVCRDINSLCSRHQSRYQRRYGRASNEGVQR